MKQAERKVGDIVKVSGYFRPVRITALHSGYYDYQYTGVTTDANKPYYFDEEDIIDEAG